MNIVGGGEWSRGSIIQWDEAARISFPGEERVHTILVAREYAYVEKGQEQLNYEFSLCGSRVPYSCMKQFARAMAHLRMYVCNIAYLFY